MATYMKVVLDLGFLMVTEHIFTTTEVFLKANKYKVRRLEEEFSSGQTGSPTSENGETKLLTAKAYINGLTATFTSVSLKMVKLRAMVFISTLTDLDIKDAGKTTKDMVRAFLQA